MDKYVSTAKAIADLVKTLGLWPWISAAAASALAQVVGLPVWAWVTAGLLVAAIALSVLYRRFRLLPLASAARRWYETHEGTLMSTVADRMSIDRTPEGRLDLCAVALLQFMDLYGRRLPSRRIRKIDPILANSGSVSGGCTVLRFQDDREPDMIDLHVHWWDFQRGVWESKR